MWTFFFIFITLALVTRLPITLSVIQWVLTVLIGPIVTVLARAPKPGDWETEEVAEGATARDLRLHPAAVAQLTSRAGECETFGFTNACLLRVRGADGGTKYLTRVLLHEESSTVALVSGRASATSTPIYVAFITFRSGGIICTFCSDGPDSGVGPQPRTECFPSLLAPEHLWPAHNAVLRTYADEAPAPLPMRLPATGEDCVAFINQVADQQRQLSVDAGLLRARVPGNRMYTVKGALVATKNAIWPWKQRHFRQLLANEEKVLTRLGEAALLAAARLYNSQRPLAPALTLKEQAELFADDRGVPRPIKPAVDLQLDERAADPKFRALLDAASGSRRMQAGWPSIWMLLASIGAGVAGYLIGLPSAALIALVILATIASSLLLATGKGSVPPAETGRARLLAQGLCPCCLYSLSELVSEADGCVTCPECGAAWRADRIIEPRTFTQQTADASFIFRRPRVNTGVASTDDRGRVCQLVPPKLKLERLIAGERSRPRLERVAVATKHAGAAKRLALALIWTIIVFGVPLIMLPNIWQLSPSEILVFIAILAVPALPPMFGILLSHIGRSGRPFIHAMLAEGLCPSCANLMPNRPAEPDGCTTCSCGAAWKVPAAKPA